jgi:OPA family glycerol-3-phosphate transporter-like MFS transporter
VWLIALIGFLMIGPYSYLAGAISLDFGARQGSATASGFIDRIGYRGGVLAGGSGAILSVRWGWKGRSSRWPESRSLRVSQRQSTCGV